MAVKNKRVAGRLRRKSAIRKRIRGTTERPRLCVFRSSQHIYAQVIDDTTGVTLASASTLTPEVRDEKTGKTKTEQARLVGAAVAKACLEKSVQKVVFDRNGFIYHGRVKAVAEAAREGGLSF